MGRYLVRAKRGTPSLPRGRSSLAWVTAAHFTHATAALARTFASPEFVNVRFPVTLPTEDIVAGLNETQPDFLFAYPSALHVLALRGPRRAPADRPAPRPEPRRAAAARDSRGGRGGLGGAVSGTCGGHRRAASSGSACDESRMHLSEDLVIVEPVDEDGRPVAPGERSAKVYLTNLFNRALPLIRYEITDEVTIRPSRARAGRLTGAWRTSRAGSTTCSCTTAGGSIRTCSVPCSVAMPAWSSTRCARRRRGAQIAVRCGAPVDLERLGAEISDATAARSACPIRSSTSRRWSGWSATRGRPSSGASCPSATVCAISPSRCCRSPASRRAARQTGPDGG